MAPITSQSPAAALRARPAPPQCEARAGAPAAGPAGTGAPAYPLEPVRGAARAGPPPPERGRVSFAWDAGFFHATAQLADREIVAQGDADGLLHHRLGDVCEFFLQAPGRAWYCEVQVTPRGHHTTLVWPGRPRTVAEALRPQSGVRAAARITSAGSPPGTEAGWIADVAIPTSLLAESGERFAPGHAWRVLVGRYNYSGGLTQLELSSMPVLPRADFHLTGEYARLTLLE